MPVSDFGSLPTSDEYGRYFNLLARVFGMLTQIYTLRRAGDTYEAARMPNFFQRLLRDVEILRLKYTYSRLDHPLSVDLSDSGMPNFVEVNNLTTDLLRKQEVLPQLPPQQHILRVMLDTLLEHATEPVKLLGQMSERAMYELLEPDKVFTAFTFGEITLCGESEGLRHYLGTWGCYDLRKNLPHIFFMFFDQDSDRQPLHIPGPTQNELVKVLHAEVGHARSVGVMALAIDDALEEIHPKLLKCVRIGPLYSPLLFSVKGSAEGESAEQSAMREFLGRYARQPDDFVVVLKESLVVSERQERVASLRRPLKGSVREVFSIPELDLECADGHASAIHRSVVLPHWLHQHLTAEMKERVVDLGRARAFITYNERGEL